MTTRPLIAALLLASAVPAHAQIPGVYRADVPYFDASETVREYLSERFAVDKSSVAVNMDTLQLERQGATATAVVGSQNCALQLGRSDTLSWRTFFRVSAYQVESADCS